MISWCVFHVESIEERLCDGGWGRLKPERENLTRKGNSQVHRLHCTLLSYIYSLPNHAA